MVPKILKKNNWCRFLAVILKFAKNTAITNKLSTLKESSIKYPVIYFNTLSETVKFVLFIEMIFYINSKILHYITVNYRQKIKFLKVIF